MRTLLLLLLAAAAIVTSGCASKPESSSRIYEGDGPTISYSKKHESAGGRLNPR